MLAFLSIDESFTLRILSPVNILVTFPCNLYFFLQSKNKKKYEKILIINYFFKYTLEMNENV